MILNSASSSSNREQITKSMVDDNSLNTKVDVALFECNIITQSIISVGEQEEIDQKFRECLTSCVRNQTCYSALYLIRKVSLLEIQKGLHSEWEYVRDICLKEYERREKSGL